MARTNFTKVDELLQEGLSKYSMQELLELSSLPKEIEGHANRRSSAEQILKRKKERRLLAAKIRLEIDLLFRHDRKVYSHLNTNHEEITALLEGIEEIDPKGMERIKQICNAIKEYKLKKEETQPSKSDEEIIIQARKRSKNDRFKVKSHWLPLH